MTHFLRSDASPDGYTLEDILIVLRKDILYRATKIMDDPRPEARKVLENNVQIMSLLGEAINLAEDSTTILNKAFGPASQKDGPRIGTE